MDCHREQFFTIKTVEITNHYQDKDLNNYVLSYKLQNPVQ